MANIKISQLPSIGNSLSASTILPVVNTTGTLTTDKVAVGNIANFTLLQAGNTLPPAFVANVAYNVTNAAQPNITSVGNLTGLRINNINNFHIPGGTNGYVLQTDGTGNLSWTAQTGNGGNGTPGGANSQLQFNLSGSFAGDPDLTWDAGNNKLVTANFAATTAIISGNANVANLNATSNVKTNAIYTDNYYYANGYVFGGGGGNGTPGGATTQVQFNDAGAFGGNTGFTFNKTSGVFTSPFLAGNGNGLANIQGANVTGFVPNANVANTAFAVAGANVTGAVQYAGTANSVAVANVVGIGNIATLALSGSSSNVLYGNGVWAPAGGANTGNIGFTGNAIYNFGGVIVENADLTHGATAALQLPDNANVSSPIQITNSYGNIRLTTGITAGSLKNWTFDQNGVLYFPGGTIAADDIEGTNNFGFEMPANVGFGILTNAGSSEWAFGSNGTLTAPGNIVINDGVDGNITSDGNVKITSNNKAWTFGISGNLTLPGNTFAVNYANGTQVNISGGSGNTGNVTFDNQIVIGTGDEFGGGGLYLAPGPAEIANGQYLQVRGGDQPSHIHFDTGNNNFYDQYFGNDNKYVKLSAGATGNILIGTDNNTGNLYRWTFDSAGDTTVPGDIKTITTGFSFTSNISDVDTTTVANAVIVTFVTSSLFPAPVTGQVTISGVVGTTETNGTWYFEAVEANQIQLYYDEALQYPVDGTGWPAYVSGGLAVAAGYNNLSITGGNVSIINNNGDTWTFDNSGQINMPEGSGSFSLGRIQSANGYPTLLGYGSGGHGGPELDWMNGDDPANGFQDNTVLRNTLYINDEGFYVGFNENEVANTAIVSWKFNPDGSTIFPTLDVDLHNGGVQSAQTLQFGDNTQQAIITGPTPPTGSGQNAQRLIIQGQRGDTTGEGGDVYIWAGDADNYAGDIKIYAGDADNVSLGYGGYINISGGQGFDEGGYVNITGGRSTNSAGAGASVVGGIGNTTGGSANLVGGQGAIGGNAYVQGGYGGGSGGNVNITGGAAGNGLAEYGNVNITAGASTWVFDNTGSFVFPGAGVIMDGQNNALLTSGLANVTIGTFVQGADGGVSWEYQGDGSGNSSYGAVGLDTAGTANTANLQFKVQLVADQGDSSTNREWLFNTNGILTFPRDSIGNTDPILTINGGTTPSINSINASVTGPANLEINALNTIFTGYNGNSITIYPDDGEISGDGNIQLWANVANATQQSWTFDTTGNLTLPTIFTGEGTDEQAIISSQRKVIPPNRFSAAIDGSTPTIVYTASQGSLTLKTTIVVQHAGFGLEMFDVSAVGAGANVIYSVSNRLNATGEDDTTVVVDWDVTQLAITLTINSGATTSYVTYDSTEFGIAVD